MAGSMNLLNLIKSLVILAHLAVFGLIGLRAAFLFTTSRASAIAFVRSAFLKLSLLLVLEVGGYVYTRHLEPNWVMVTHLNVANDELAQALGRARIVQITDLHIEHFGFREHAMIWQVNRQRPDWIVITGDLLNEREGWSVTLEVIKRLKAAHGVWVVPGNTDNAFLSADEFQEGLSKIGAHVLRNSRRELGQTGAWLVGVDDPVEHQDQLKEALKGLNPQALPPIILLAHSPDIFPAATDAHIPLVLVGHTHGGQVGVEWIRRFSKYADRGPYVSGGLYRDHDTQLYVNRGIGWKIMPYRFLAPPEVTVIQFRPRHGGLAAFFGFANPGTTARTADRELWLADFESKDEHIVRWKIANAQVRLTTDHATHGQHAVQVTFQPGEVSSLTMDQYLSGDRTRRDWSGYGTLTLEVYNDQPTQELLVLTVRDDKGHEHHEEVALKAHAAQRVSLSLADVNELLDRAHIAQLSVSRVNAKTPAVFYLDAIRLEPGQPSATVTSASPESDAVSPTRSSMPDATVTPDQLERWHFTQEIQRWQVNDPATGRSAIRIPITLVGPETPLSVGFSVSGGVPFAMGQFQSSMAVRLQDLGGTLWPIQTRVLATWEDGSVKWLLVTTRVPLNARSRQLWLEYGPSVRADQVESPLRLEDTPEAVIVTTGPLRFSVSKRRFTLFESAAVDRNGDGVFAESERLAGRGDLVVKFHDREFRSSQDTKSYTLQVEEAGPLRATLKASGWFRDASGNGFCQFVVRLQAFAGLPQVRVYHTVIYTGYPANRYNGVYEGIRLPDNEPIQELRLELPVTVASHGSVLMADERKTYTVPLDATTTISQLAHDAWQLRHGEQVLPVDGTRTAGWLLVQNADAGAIVGVRDAWQQYPKELVADPTSGQLQVKLWPSSAGLLDVQTGPEAIGPDDVARGSAFGLGKTHELWVGFLGRPIDGGIASGLAGLWQEPWLLSVHPAWLQATNAWGEIGPTQSDRFKEGEQMVEDLFSWAERQPANFAWYGMLNYGDTLTWYRKEAYDKSYDDWGWHPEGRWGWHNCEAVGTHGGALMSFMRTQALKYFRFGEAKARHVMDVDTVHYNTVANDPRLTRKISDEFSQVGSMHRHSAYHWSGRNEEATHTNVTGLLMYYYLTGYERAFDVAKEVGGFLLRDPVTYTKHPDIAPSRAIGNVVWGDVLLYEATWDRRYRTSADRWVRVLLKGQQKDGTWFETYNPQTITWSGDVKTNYIVYHILPALIAYHRLTGNPEVAQAIIKGTEAMLAKEPYLPFFDALAYSSLVSGNGEYLNTALRGMRAMARHQQYVEDPVRNGMVFDKMIYDRVGPLLYTVPFAIGAMDMPDFPTLEKTTPVSVPIATSPTATTPPSYETLIVPSTEKVFPDVATPTRAHANPAQLSLARNEFESIQLVLRSPASALQQVTVETHDLTQLNGSGVIPRSAMTWSPVGFVKTRQPDYPVSRVGWWPDPLPASAPFDVQAGWWQPIWLTVYAAPGTPAGDYTGTVTIRPANAPAQQVAIAVKVWDFELPMTPSLKSAFDVYPNRIESAYRQFFPQWWSRWQPRVAELMQRIYDDLIRHRLAPILNADLRQPDVVTEVRRLRARGLSAFAVGHRGGSFDNNWPMDATELAQLQPEYRFDAHQLRDAGLMDAQYVYTFDEPELGLPRVAKVAEMIHQADPHLKNLVTLNTTPEVSRLASWFKDIDVVCMRNVAFDPTIVEPLKRMGKEVWLYVSGPKPPYPTLVIDAPAVAYRILPWMCWKYRLQGLLYWSVNYWTTNPYQEPMNTPWQQNGNGSLYYPGAEGPVPSIRLEVLRDGMEDYEYLVRLQTLIERVRSRTMLMADPAVQTLLADAEALLTIQPALVGSMASYAQDPSVLLSQRDAIAVTIEKLQHLIGS